MAGYFTIKDLRRKYLIVITFHHQSDEGTINTNMCKNNLLQD